MYFCYNTVRHDHESSLNKMYSLAGPHPPKLLSLPSSHHNACHVAPGIFFAACSLSFTVSHKSSELTRSRQTLAGTRPLIFSPNSTLRQETCITAPPQHSDPGIVTLPLFVWLCTDWPSY